MLVGWNDMRACRLVHALSNPWNRTASRRDLTEHGRRTCAIATTVSGGHQRLRQRLALHVAVSDVNATCRTSYFRPRLLDGRAILCIIHVVGDWRSYRRVEQTVRRLIWHTYSISLPRWVVAIAACMYVNLRASRLGVDHPNSSTANSRVGARFTTFRYRGKWLRLCITIIQWWKGLKWARSQKSGLVASNDRL